MFVDQHDCQASAGSNVLLCKSARCVSCCPPQITVFLFRTLGAGGLEQTLDPTFGKWCLHSGVDLCFLVWMMSTLVLCSRPDATVRGHPLECAMSRTQVGPATTTWYGSDLDSLPMLVASQKMNGLKRTSSDWVLVLCFQSSCSLNCSTARRCTHETDRELDH